MMEYGLNMQQLPEYCFSAHKAFDQGEKHVRRVAGEDVLILMLGGTLHFWEDGKRIDLEEGEYYIQRRGYLQEGKIPSDTAKYYYIHFKGEYRRGGQVIPLRGKSEINEMDSLFQALDFLQVSDGSRLEKTAIFYQILSKINKKGALVYRSRLATQVMQMVYRDLKHPYTLEEIAEECGYSKNSVITIFKSETGRTPSDLIRNVRLDAAKKLLLDSDLPIHVIAEKTGYSEYSSFYKAFMKQEKISPLLWRKQKRL